MYNHQIPLMTGSYSKESQNISTGIIHHSKIQLKTQKSAFQRTTQISQKHPLLLAQPAIILSNLITDGMWKSATIIILSTYIQNKFGFNHFETDYPGDYGGFPPSFHVLSNLLLADYPAIQWYTT
jgi:hypothetical protein